MKKLSHFLRKRLPLLAWLTATSLVAQPTENRSWTSTAGTKLEAKAISLSNDDTTLETEDGRNLKIKLSQLVPEDRAFLKKHFALTSHLLTAQRRTITVPQRAVEIVNPCHHPPRF